MTPEPRNESIPEFAFSASRIRLACIGLSVAGSAVALPLFGVGVTAAFLVGALASYWNLRLLHAVVERLGPDPGAGSRRVIGMFALRYPILALLGYVTLELFGSNPAAFCVGLLVAVFAMLMNAVSELIYARA